MTQKSFETGTTARGERSAEVKHELEKTSAAEFLIKFQELRTDVRAEASEQLTGVQRMIAQGKNTLSIPKNIVLGWRRDRMQQKYDRLSSKQDTSRFDFINRHIDRKTEQAYGALRQRTEGFEAHSNMMEHRFESVDQKGQEREQAIEAKRKELVEARLKAIESKIIRHERQEQRKKLEKDYKQKYTYAERESAIGKFLDQDAFKKRIRTEAEDIFRRKADFNPAPA